MENRKANIKGRDLAFIRDKSGLRQIRVARAAGVPLQRLIDIEKERVTVGSEVMQSLLDAIEQLAADAQASGVGA